MTDQMTLSDALLDYYENRRGRYSASTWKAHDSLLERMRTFVAREVGSVPYLTDVDERMMVKFFNRYRQKSPATFNNYRQYANLFWGYCRNEAWITRSPMRHIDPVRAVKRVRLRLSPEEMLGMLEAAPPRDRAALAIGMNTALRAGDIADLTVGQVNLTNDTLTAWTEKTDEEVELPITADLHDELVRWFDAYAAATGCASAADLPNEWRLIPPARGQAADPRNPRAGRIVVLKTHGRYRHPEQIVQRALAKLGHPTKGEGFHTLRRSAARELFNIAVEEGNVDALGVAQALLGHKSRRNTETYLGITHERMKRDELMRGQRFLTRGHAPATTVTAVSPRARAQ